MLNLVQGIFGKGMGYWLKDFGAELHELEVAYNDAVDPGRRRALPRRPPRDRARHRRPLRDAVGHALRRVGDRPDRARARRADAGRLRLLVRRHPAPRRRLAARRLRRRAAEVPRRTGRHVADDGQRRRLGADPLEPDARRAPRSSRCSTGRSSGSTARSSRSRRPSPTSTASRPRATCCSRSGSRSRSPSTSARRAACRAGVRAMGLEPWPRSDAITAACVDRDRRARRAHRRAGARALPRALRRDDLGRPGRRQPRPDRPHGPVGLVGVPGRGPRRASGQTLRRPRRGRRRRRRPRGGTRRALPDDAGRRAV